MTTPSGLRERFVVRLAGLPAERVQRLGSRAGLAWAERVLAEEDVVRRRADVLSDLLHTEIGGLQDAARRQGLIRLRREVFNDRLPTDPEAVAALAESLAAPTRDALLTWLRDRWRLVHLHERGDVLLEGELASGRESLRELALDHRLRAGLLLASPSLEAQLDDYARAALPDKRARKVERSLLAYLHRSAVKTSPFSTFTSVALGSFEDAAESLAETVAESLAESLAESRPDVPAGPASAVRLNVVVLARLFDAVAADPSRLADLPVALASGWEREEDRVRYVRRSVRSGDDAAAVTFDSASDQLFFLRRSKVLDEMVSRVADAQTLRFQDLADWLGQKLGAGREDSDRYVADLLDLGILRVPLLATDVHSADPVADLQRALRALATGWSLRLASDLEPVARCVAAYPAAGVAQRRVLLSGLRETLESVLSGLGSGDSPTGVTLPQTLLYEDSGAGPVAWTRDLHDTLAAPLAGLERVLPAFDQTLRHTLTLQGFFVARFGPGGRCDDLTGLVHEFHEDLYDEYVSFTARTPRDRSTPVPDPNWMHVPGIARLDAARTRFAERLGELLGSHPDAEELTLSAALVDEVADLVGRTRHRGVTALTHYVQPLAGAGERDPQVVHNQVYGGLSFPFSRFTHCLPTGSGRDLAEELRALSRDAQPDGVVFAEVTGGSATTNLNLHPSLTDHEIVGPGEVSTVPPDRRILLEDLYLVHDEPADRLVLRSRRLGCEVVPVYLGYLVPQALPAMPRTLLLLSPSSTLDLDLWAGVPESPASPGAEEVLRRPRLRLGSMILSRRTWTVRAGALPLLPPRTPLHERFLAWHRWRTLHGVPEEVFVRVHPSSGAGPGRAKPQYLDLTSPVSLLAFETVLAPGGVRDRDARVVLSERLPRTDQLSVTAGGRPHVAELAVETVTVHAGGPAAGDLPLDYSPRRAS